METELQSLIERVMPVLDEQSRKVVMGAAAEVIGRGGTSEMANLTGVPYSIVRVAREQMRIVTPDAKGRGELGNLLDPSPMGRRPSKVRFPGLESSLLAMMQGDPEREPDSPITWTTDSTRLLSKRLEEERDIRVGYVTIVRLLENLDFHMQMRTRYGGNMRSDNREAQFRWIEASMRESLLLDQPILTGDIKRKGEGVAPTCTSQESGSENAANGLSEKEFAQILDGVELWWENMGRERFRSANRIMLLLDGAGWSGERKNLWVPRLRKLSAITGTEILVSLIPPGTYRLNHTGQVMTSDVNFVWENGNFRAEELKIRQIGAGPAGIAGVPEPGLSEKMIEEWNMKVSCEESRG